jgi:hypothetical protein
MSLEALLFRGYRRSKGSVKTEKQQGMPQHGGMKKIDDIIKKVC